MQALVYHGPGQRGWDSVDDPSAFATHHFGLDETMAAYDTFADAGATDALKVVLTGTERAAASAGQVAAGVAG